MSEVPNEGVLSYALLRVEVQQSFDRILVGFRMQMSGIKIRVKVERKYRKDL